MRTEPVVAGELVDHWHGDGCDPPHAEPVQAVPCGSSQRCDGWSVAVVTATRDAGPPPERVALYRCAEHVRPAALAAEAVYRQVGIRALP